LTDKIAGKTKNIVDKPIVLTVYSHTCPDLTMIDLPGITRIPIDGQDANIE
jgi:vacuolar protein sorting-associated protein 1